MPFACAVSIRGYFTFHCISALWVSGQQLGGEVDAEGGTTEEQLQRALARIVQLEDQNVALWEVGSFATDIGCAPQLDSRRGSRRGWQAVARGAQCIVAPSLALSLLQCGIPGISATCVPLITRQFLLSLLALRW